MRSVRPWPPLLLLLLLLALAGCASAGPGPVLGPVEPPAVGGWITYWDLDAGLARVEATPGRLSDVFLFAVQLDGRGLPVAARPDLDWTAVARRVRAAGATPWLTVVNDVAGKGGAVELKDPAVVHLLLADPARRQAHRDRLVELARAWGVAGIDVDFERLRADDREPFSVYVAELAAALHRAGLALSVTVQPKTEDRRQDGPGAADWAALCRSADRLQVMLYNEHSGRTGPGPIATLSFMDRVMSLALRQCPAERVVPAVKTVGREWTPDGSGDLPFARAVALARAQGAAVARHPDGEVPWFVHGPPEARRVAYYEDARSLRLKVEALARRGARRVVLWPLGAEDPDYWAAPNRHSSSKVPSTAP